MFADANIRHLSDDDDDKTIINEVEDKLKVPKTFMSTDSIRRESQDTVIFAGKTRQDGPTEPDRDKSGKDGKLKKTLSFQSSVQSDAICYDEGLSRKHKKKKKKKHKRKSYSETSTSQSSLSSRSDDIKVSEQEDKQKSKHSRKDKHRKKESRSKSCWYCKNSCEFHRDRNLHLLAESNPNKPRSSTKTTDEGTQAGPSCIPWNDGMNNRHYLFDPCADALFDFPRTHDQNILNSYRHDSKTEAAKVAKLYLTTNPCQHQSKSRQQKESFITESKQTTNNNPMSFALSELLRGQLDLTANFLSSQKKLYAAYCSNLDLTSRHNPQIRNINDLSNAIKIPEKKLRRSHNVEHGEEDTEERFSRQVDDKSTSMEEDVILEEYESEFEDDSEDDRLIEMKNQVDIKH